MSSGCWKVCSGCVISAGLIVLSWLKERHVVHLRVLVWGDFLFKDCGGSLNKPALTQTSTVAAHVTFKGPNFTPARARLSAEQSLVIVIPSANSWSEGSLCAPCDARCVMCSEAPGVHMKNNTRSFQKYHHQSKKTQPLEHRASNFLLESSLAIGFPGGSLVCVITQPVHLSRKAEHIKQNNDETERNSWEEQSDRNKQMDRVIVKVLIESITGSLRASANMKHILKGRALDFSMEESNHEDLQLYLNPAPVCSQ